MKNKRQAIAMAGVAIFFGISRLAAAPTAVKLYALDCGTIETKDIGFFSDTGDYDGKPGKLADSCFLIVHPKGILLWDTGLGDNLVGHPAEMPAAGVRFYETVSLVSQLAQLKLDPKDITYLGISHSHKDHTGNAALFLKSKWLVQQKEIDWAAAASPTDSADAQLPALAKQANIHPISGDYDVFGDGLVKILATPGHTPGHQSLKITLEHSGVVILSGDLYHMRENFEHHRVPVFNSSRAETLASEDRIDKILQNTHGRLVIQHDSRDFESLPKFPNYLD